MIEGNFINKFKLKFAMLWKIPDDVSFKNS